MARRDGRIRGRSSTLVRSAAAWAGGVAPPALVSPRAAVDDGPDSPRQRSLAASRSAVRNASLLNRPLREDLRPSACAPDARKPSLSEPRAEHRPLGRRRSRDPVRPVIGSLWGAPLASRLGCGPSRPSLREPARQDELRPGLRSLGPGPAAGPPRAERRQPGAWLPPAPAGVEAHRRSRPERPFACSWPRRSPAGSSAHRLALGRLPRRESPNGPTSGDRVSGDSVIPSSWVVYRASGLFLQETGRKVDTALRSMLFING